MPELLTETQKSVQRMRAKIISGDYQLSQALPQRGIAQELGVSPIVARESMRILEKEGLVEIIPKWGARVISFQMEKVRGIFIVREALEGMSARLLAETITEDQLQLLYELADKTDIFFSDTDARRRDIADAHYALHIKMVELTGLLELCEGVRRINLQYLLWINSTVVSHAMLSRPAGWHRRLIDVIAQKDQDKAENFMRSHVRKGFEDIRASLEEKEKEKEEDSFSY